MVQPTPTSRIDAHLSLLELAGRQESCHAVGLVSDRSGCGESSRGSGTDASAPSTALTDRPRGCPEREGWSGRCIGPLVPGILVGGAAGETGLKSHLLIR